METTEVKVEIAKCRGIRNFPTLSLLLFLLIIVADVVVDHCFAWHWIVGSPLSPFLPHLMSDPVPVLKVLASRWFPSFFPFCPFLSLLFSLPELPGFS